MGRIGLVGCAAAFTAAGPAFRRADECLVRGGKRKREIDAHSLVAMLGRHTIGHVFVEQVGAMPGQGVSGVFAFGKAYGIAVGVLAAMGTPLSFISPVVWKRALQVPAAKDGARARASQLMPAAVHHWPLVKHHGHAEAALIALYGLRQLAGIATLAA